MNEFIFNWSIENASYTWHEFPTRLNSPPFMADTLQNTVWYLSLDPRTRSARHNQGRSISLYLFRGEDDGPKNLNIDCEFSCVSSNNLSLQTSSPRKVTVKNSKAVMISLFFMRRHEVFDSRKDLYLRQDILTLRCRMWRFEGEVNKFGQCFGRTRLELERILSVEDFDPTIARKKTISVLSKKRKLLLSVNVSQEKDGLKIDIHRRKTVKINTSTFKFSAVGRNRNKLSYADSWFDMPAEVVWVIPFSNTENKASVINKLKLTCEFIYSTGKETNSLEKIRPCSFECPTFSINSILSFIPSGKLSDYPTICKDLWDLYSNQTLCDVELKTQTRSFWVHKAVLCARSPVFLTMFSCKMRETMNMCVEIEDLENDTLEKFLAFLYTDYFEESEWNSVVQLYYVGDKYQIERLKYFCCSFFMNNMDDLRMCELMMLADKHSDSHLKTIVEDYFVRDHKRIFRSSTWKEFSEKQPLMAAKIILCKPGEKRKKEKHAQEYKLSSYPNALDDFRSLYQSQAISDIVIKAASGMFPAHKTMLCACSSSLRRVLTREKSTDSLEIEDLEEETVSRLLLFLYTDSLGDITLEDASKLYHAAFIYQIERLKIKCSCFFLETLRDYYVDFRFDDSGSSDSDDFRPKQLAREHPDRPFSRNLDETTAGHLLQLAHEHRDAKLKSIVEDYISLYDKEIKLPEILSNTNKNESPKRMETRLSKKLKLENSR